MPALEQFEDTAAWAAAMALPRGLGDASRALGAAAQKDDEGRRLMMRMAKPRKARKGEDPTRTYWWDDQERLDKLIAYCRQDVETERAIRSMLVPLGTDEREVYLLDQRMNDRGVRIDVDFVRALKRLTAEAKERLDREMAQATGYEVTACSQVSALTAWISREIGRSLDSLDKNAIEALLSQDLPEHVRRAVELRKDAAKSSTAKLDARSVPGNAPVTV